MFSAWKQFAILSSLSLLFFATPVFAMEASPLKYEASIDPGKSQNFVLTIKNNETGRRYFRISTTGMRTSLDGKLVFEKGSDRSESWVKATPSAFSLLAGESRIINVSVSVPAGEEPGSHSLAFLATEEGQNDKTVTVSANIAIPLKLVVSGKVIESLVITKWEAKAKVTSASSWPFRMELRNVGNIDVGGEGVVTVIGPMHKKVLQQNQNIGNTILRGSTRQLQVALAPSESLLPGKYTATLSVMYGNGKNIVQKTYAVWYLPAWSVTLFVLFIAVIIAISLWRTKKPSKI